jgi:hypothetical protein
MALPLDIARRSGDRGRGSRLIVSLDAVMAASLVSMPLRSGKDGVSGRQGLATGWGRNFSSVLSVLNGSEKGEK